MLTEVAPAWGRAVYHVLAHIVLPEPGATYEPDYVRWCAGHLGSASERTMAQDAQVISRSVKGADSGQRLQLVAWLFKSVAEGATAARLGTAECARDRLVELGLNGGSLATAAELLVCAVALESDTQTRLPAIEPDSLARLSAELDRAEAWAPWLHRTTVRIVPALWRRGRLFESQIWVGDPTPGRGPGLQHIVWQVCHEATVGEVQESAPDLAERDVEGVALVLLGQRAVLAGQTAAHAAWLARLSVPAASGRLSDAQAAVLGRLRSAPG